MKNDTPATTATTQGNRAGQATTEMNKGLLSVANVNGPTTLTNPDVIDVLPKQGDAAGSSFHGTFTFTGATVQSGGSGVKILYTSSGAVNPALTIAANALRVGDHLLERMGMR